MGTSGYHAGKVRELASQILGHRQAYYTGKPTISDAEYDVLEEQLRSLSPDHPIFDQVGAASLGQSQNEKVKHAVPMLSLQKTYSLDELMSWKGEEDVVGTWKVDGNSLSLVYRAGRLEMAKTRGNGRLGEDVTGKAKWVSDIIPQLSTEQDIEIRGELYCSEHAFAELVEDMLRRSLERPSNPRNIVAGLLGRKLHEDLAHYFNFLAFDVISSSEKFYFATEVEKFSWLQDQGFAVPKPQVIKNEHDVKNFLETVKAMMNQGEIGLDGAVFSYNNRNLHQELGETAHHPRYKMSFKWQGQTAVSRIKEIAWATSRLGILTPVAVIEPVVLSGAKIANVTLHNAEHVMAYNLKSGDQIEIVRSGEVIPKFLQVKTAAPGQYQWPSSCGSCGSALEFDGVRLKCMNQLGCPAQQMGSILNWIRCVEIDDLSEKRVQNMIDLNLLSDISDLYRLTVDDLLLLPLTKEKMAQKLFTNIQKSKSLPLARFLNGLGIEGMGLTSWEKILSHANSLDQVLGLTSEELTGVDGFAEKSAQQIVSGLMVRQPLIDRLLELGVAPQAEELVAQEDREQQPLFGKSFVITGTLSRPRQTVANIIKSAGGKIVGSVSKNTYALVTNDKDTQSSKMKKAQDLGIPIWSEDFLISQIEGEP